MARAAGNSGIQFGYKLMSETTGPRELVRNAKLAEDAGFDFVGQAFENRRLDAIALLTGQHFSADFQQDAAVRDGTHAWPN